MDESHLPKSKWLIIIAWIICLIATLNYSFDFFIRAAPGVMAEDLKNAFNIGYAKIGWLSSAYFISYTIMQIPAGVILDKYNRKVVISIATALCVLGNYLFSATNHYEVSFIGRILMGIGSAFGFIGAAKMAGMWLPQRFFSTFIGFTTVIGILGGLFTDVFLSNLVAKLGWKEGNAVFTYFGIALFLLIVVFIKDNKKHVEKFTHFSEASLTETIIKLFKIIMSPKFWVASLIGASIFMPINVLGSLWGVSLIEDKLGVDQSVASHLNSFLFAGAAIGFAVFGIISAYTNRFRLLLILSLVSSGLLIIVIAYIPMDKNIFILSYLALGIMAGPQAITFAIAKIISPPGTSASSTAGVNMINNLFPVILLPGIGYILSLSQDNIYLSYNQSFNLVIAILAGLLLACIPLAFFLPKEIDA
ncbi:MULTISPECIES: MFS transporter [unclassified Francisella]|uniref:MFS transporter n=1 Tax=unclassified Francisella TaxID=2610885 RepID=UPI002E343992|nr:MULTISPECIES: MFS transporter [unclassified Francisella]MED7819892.1 MFS transporter [Francisella sp. 19S2-4]MED7830732.1 MFS transporter [Francisella sp. 19S2-10]